MKKLYTLIICAGLLLGVANAAKAIDFKVKGEWLITFTAGEASLLRETRVGNVKNKTTQEHFTAGQRVRLQLEAVAS